MIKRKYQIILLNLFFYFSALSGISFLPKNLGFCYLALAQDDNKSNLLTNQIIKTQDKAQLLKAFSELKDIYFKENKYNELIELLKSLGQKEKNLAPFINFYTALSRYQQLKYLEEAQKWDEYFEQGNAYKEQLLSSLKEAISSSLTQEPVNLYSRFLLWQFHQDQQDTFCEGALEELWNSALEYAKATSDIQPLKETADQFLSYNLKPKARELYSIYVEKLSQEKIKDSELKEIALKFYKEGNSELASAVYDVYLKRAEQALSKEELAVVLTEIAKAFLDLDRLYAEKMFKKIEEAGTKNALTEELTLLRGLNLEKAGEYSQARDVYLDFIERFPSAASSEKVNLKIGITSAYILRDIQTAKDHFKKIAASETISSEVISSLYYLGLLNQWEGDLTKAKEYYNCLLEKAKDDFAETKVLAEERLKEINEEKNLDYNLKTFLDACLKEESAALKMDKAQINPSVYSAKKGEEINIAPLVFTEPSGCLQVEMQYLWSGHTGKTKPLTTMPAFNTSYSEKGVKEINLVVVSPSGIIDRSIILIDIE
ncbi:MAG: hypothetical protein QMD94_03830 [Candidatus Omnitrophota bacterium]|nr:hypothetical protein [Candidatus Omnitrophota bacterium]